MSNRLVAAMISAGVAVLISGCSHPVDGEAVSVFHNPFNVGGLPATDGPSGLRPDAPAPTREVVNTDGGEEDEFAVQAISDIEQFWSQAYGEPLQGSFEPVDAVLSWNAEGPSYEFCGADTLSRVNAGFCPVDKTIGWDRGVLLPKLGAGFGDMAITWMLSHEYGHSIQRQAKLMSGLTPVLVNEQQADCLSGAYVRWVVEGKSPRFTLNTSDGLNNVLAAMIAFRDPVFSEEDFDMGVDEHGTAFERISAFQFGFTDGISACAGIDIFEVVQRRGDLPVAMQQDRPGESEVNEETVLAVVEALGALASPADPADVTFDAGLAESCADARPSPPVSYCPSTNTIVVDMPLLKEMGTKDDSDMRRLIFGDSTAYSVVASRYMLALQHERGMTLDDASASLRTACLTGVAAAALTEPVEVSDGSTIALSAGDLDEMVTGILTNGLVASDVNGDSVPSGFSRIEAFRTGVLGDIEQCLSRHP